MTKHLIVFYGRTGRNNGFESSEIHPDEYQMYYDKLFPLQIEWAMKYHVMTGTHVTRLHSKFR